ncbi:MAG TPA: hypothetical protein VN622_02010 [Clostridia bacterium]|nr:hypothetical protein [Clostridia bacterium]
MIFLITAIASPRTRVIYVSQFAEPARERMFWASVAFFLTFALVRALTMSIRAGIGPFKNVVVGGRHIHHLVWGIALLLLVGYGWLIEIGGGAAGTSRLAGRAMAVLYGIGAALTLDEFALWFNLKDVYWAREGRESIDAVVLFGALLSVVFWGGPFFNALFREAGKLMH